MRRLFGTSTCEQAEANATYERGLSAYEDGDYAGAVEHLSQIANDAGLTGTLASFYLGEAHARLGAAALQAARHADAIAHLSTARKLNPQSAGLSRYLAACYAGLSRYDWAAAELEKCDGDGDTDRVIRLAHAFARDGKITRAVETLVDAMDREPHRLDLRLQLGLIYASAEEHEDAVCVLTEAVELAPYDIDARRSLALALAAAGDAAEAVEHLAMAQRLRPHDRHLALLLTMAIDAAKTNCFALGIDVTLGSGETADEKSIAALGELVAQEPDLVEAFLALPPTAVDAEIFAMLAAALERALEHHPEYADLHYHCSRVYVRMGRRDAAVTRLDEALSINPRYVQALIQLGRIFAQMDRRLEAAQRLRAAIACGGDYPDVHYLLGELYRRDRRLDAARCAYERALELNKDYAAAREALEMLNAA